MAFQGERSCPRVTPSLHTQGSPGPTSLPLFLTALCFMFCGQYPALYYLHHQRHRLPSASSSLHSQGEGTILRVGSQTGACRNPWAAAGRVRPLEAMSNHYRCCWALWLGQRLPQNQSLESKGPCGTLIFLKYMWRGHTIWHGGNQGEGNTKVLSPQRASIQSEPLGA